MSAITSPDSVCARAQSVLKMSAIPEINQLTVYLQDGVLFICGELSLFYHKQLAQEALRCLCAEMDVMIRNLAQVTVYQTPSDAPAP